MTRGFDPRAQWGLAAMTVQGKKWYKVPLGFLEERRCFRVMLAKRCSECSEGNYFDWQKYGVLWSWGGTAWPGLAREIKLGRLGRSSSRRIPPFRVKLKGLISILKISCLLSINYLSSTPDALREQEVGGHARTR